MDQKETEHWKHFFQFLRKEVENIKCKIFIDDRLIAMPNRKKPWTEEEIQRRLCQDRVKLATVVVGTLQISGHKPVRLFGAIGKIQTNIIKSKRRGVEYEYNQYEANLQLTPECITALKSLMIPENFRCTNPQERQHKLEATGIELCKKKGFPMFHDIYDYKGENAIPESHLDVYYEEIFESTSGKEYNVTLTTRTDNYLRVNDIANTGTEYMKVPCMANFEQISSLSTKGVNILYGDNKKGRAKTFVGDVLYFLTAKYCDQNTNNWKCHQPGVLHNSNSMYWHRSPRLALASWPARFVRSHYEIEYGDVDKFLEKGLRVGTI